MPDKANLTPVVYTMGKVASSSVSTAIIAAGLPCHDIHSLDAEYLKKSAKEYLDRGQYPPPHICVSMAHRDRLMVKPKRCLYISLVRDPIARNLSAFFQNLHEQKAEIRDETDARRMFAKFQETYFHSVPLSWLDREFGKQVGIDVYADSFDHAARYCHIKRSNTVIFRTDCPDETKSAVLSKALGQRIEVKRENDSNNKEYNEIYSNVKLAATFSAGFVDKMYSSKYARHFWSAAEREVMAAKWLGPAQD